MIKHGMRHTTLYGVWAGMKERCLNPRGHNYKRYGGCGITVCAEWLDFAPFYAWAKDKHKQGLELHRKDSNGPYSPDNCEFLTQDEHGKQPKKSDRIITFNGVTKRVSDWARELNVYSSTINMRIDKYGWSIEKALSKGGKPNSALNSANKKPPVQETI